jgi:pimeloyl-ACP methyl ester carboxylesterase
VDRRDVPSGAHRATGRPTDRTRLIAAAEIYPAREAGITVRFVPVREHVRLRVLEAGPRDGQPIVLVHGWGASVYSYRGSIPVLADAGSRVIAVDLPGHGLSDKPPELEQYTREGMTGAIAAVLDALDVRDAVVVGVSMGGVIAANLAIGHHPRVDRVALFDPVGFAPVRFISVAQMITPLALRDYASYIVAKPLVSWFLHLAYWDQSRVTDEDVEQYWATAAQPGFGAALGACLHRFSWEPFTRAQLEGVTCPVLLVLGTHDHLITGSETWARIIPNLTVVHVDGGHAVNEECPDETNAALLAFAHE